MATRSVRRSEAGFWLAAAALAMLSWGCSGDPNVCAPACRPGYTCARGACVSLCNPACGANETCTADLRCVAAGTDAAAADVVADRSDVVVDDGIVVPDGAAPDIDAADVVGALDAEPVDAGVDAADGERPDAGADAGADAGDAGIDAADAERPDAGVDAAGGIDAGIDAGADSSTDAEDAAGPDARPDVLPLTPAVIPDRRVTCGPRAGTPSVTAGAADRYVLRGRVVSPSVVFSPGEVLVVGGTIACVAASCSARPEYAGATIINTAGIIYPGLIDGHNHVAYNWLPPWEPPRRYDNRYQWQRAASYDAFVTPYRDNVGTHECAMAKYGEIRSLVAGTTSIQGGPNRTCSNRTLVRNVEFGNDFGGVDHHRTNILGISTVTGTALTTLQREIRDGTTTTYIVHLSEGVDELSRAEFDQLETKMLLNETTVVVHGTGMGLTEHNHLGTARGRLVWSPRSNVILYGGTTNVPAALDNGVMVSLGPDWTPSGGPNLLSELRYAREVSRLQWGGRLTSRDLVEMVTSRAAEVMDREAFIGRLAEGLYADVLVIPDTGCDPYDSLIDAVTADVELVMVAGRPMYGDRALMTAMPAAVQTGCENVAFCGIDKRVCVAQTATDNGLNQTLTDIDTEIRSFYPTPYPLVPICP